MWSRRPNRRATPACWVLGVVLGGTAAACAGPGAEGPDDAGRRVRISATAVEVVPDVESRELMGGTEFAARETGSVGDGDFVVAPIPFSNATIGSGLTFGAAYLVPFDSESPPSVIGAGCLYSDNDSYAAAAAFKGYLAGDRYRVLMAVGTGRLNFDLDVAGRPVPLEERVVAAQFEILRRCFERVYLGPTLLVFGVDTSLRSEDLGAVADEELDADNLGFGLHALRDTRDGDYYPRSGSLVDASASTYVPALGSDFSYRIGELSGNRYLGIGESGVLALRASGRFAFGEVPFYGQSYLGSGPDLRGYAVGTVRDDSLLATQAEYRQELGWRLGAVGFAGVGTVLPSLDDWSEAEAYPSAGFGLRFLLEEKNHINFRIDFAWGDGQEAIYVGVGEAF